MEISHELLKKISLYILDIIEEELNEVNYNYESEYDHENGRGFIKIKLREKGD